MHGSATDRRPGIGTAPLAYSVPDAAKVLGLGERKTWQLVHDGDIDSVKVGARRIVTRAALEAYLDRLSQDATHPPAGPGNPGPGRDEQPDQDADAA